MLADRQVDVKTSPQIRDLQVQTDAASRTRRLQFCPLHQHEVQCRDTHGRQVDVNSTVAVVEASTSSLKNLFEERQRMQSTLHTTRGVSASRSARKEDHVSGRRLHGAVACLVLI